MTIISRYVFRQTAGTLLLILLSLSGVVWIALALKQLNVVTTQGSDAWTLLALTTLALPNLMALIAPFAFLIAAIHVINRLNGDSELIVLSASGATIWRLARPLLAIALMVSVGVAFVNHVAMPWTLRKLRTTVLDMRTNLLSQVLQPGRFTPAEGGKIVFHIRERSPNGELFGILMQDSRDPKQSMSYLAERGLVVQRNDDTYLYMERGHILRRTEKSPATEILEFASYAVDLDGFEKKAGPLTFRPRERYTPELIADLRHPVRVSAAAAPSEGANARLSSRPAGERTAPADVGAGETPAAAGAQSTPARRQRDPKGQIYAELHERLSSPLYPIVFAFVTLAFLGSSKSTRTSAVQATVACFIIAASVRVGGMALNNMVVAKPGLYVLMYIVPLAAIGISAAAIMLADKPWLTPGLRDQQRRRKVNPVRREVADSSTTFATARQ